MIPSFKKREKKMTVKKRVPEQIVSLSILCLIGVMLNCGCLEDNTEDIPVMTIRENVDDYVEKTDNSTKTISGDYKSLNNGDKIIIRDTIYKSIHDQTTDVTYIEFESFTGYPVVFQGDLSYKFQLGDMVDLTVHILTVSFPDIIDNETWTVTLETFKEGWDTSDNSLVPIPQKYLTKTNN